MAFLRALSKMGLVQLSPEEAAALDVEAKNKNKKAPEMSMEDIDKLLAEDAKSEAAAAASKRAPAQKAAAPARAEPARPAARTTGASPSSSSPAASPSAAAPGAVVKNGARLQVGRPFEEIFKAAGVASSPYPAEKLLRLLDGLAAMDERTRKTAVMAMDAADDTWTIADPVLDAKRKIKVLVDEKQSLTEQLQAAEQTFSLEQEKLNAYQAEAKRVIREKITALEGQLERDLQQVAERRASMTSLIERDRDAARLEHDRVDKEVARLEQVPKGFEEALR